MAFMFQQHPSGLSRTPMPNRSAGTIDQEDLDVVKCDLHYSADVEVLEVTLELLVFILQVKENLATKILATTSMLNLDKAN